MRRNRFYVKIVFPDLLTSREFLISTWKIKVGLIFLATFLVAFAYLLYAFLRYEVDTRRLQELRATNAHLHSQLNLLSSRVDSLSALLDSVFMRDVAIRVLAGLKVPPKEVRRMGVGGTATSSSDEFAEPKVREIQENLDRLLRFARFERQSLEEVYKKLQTDEELRRRTPSIPPTQGVYTSGFGFRRDPFTGERRFHEGLDIRAPIGTPVIAPADGIVKRVGYDRGYGRFIEIDHGYGITTRYAHLSETLVRIGQRVKRGDLIGRVGNTGRSTAPHLHYEVRLFGKPKNPVDYIINAEVVYD